MQFAAAVSRQPDSVAAAQAIARAARRDLGDGPVDLALLFLTGEHVPAAPRIATAVREALGPRLLLGCSAEGVLGAGEEIERAPGLSLLAARLPGVTLSPFSLELEAWQALDDAALRRRAGDAPRALLVLGDPFTTPTDEMLAAFGSAFPGVPLVGGMASAGTQPGENVLLWNEQILYDSLIGVAMAGPLRVETAVSQGCRPVGPPLRVTGAEGNVIETLRFRPALEMAQTVLSELPVEDQALLENGLYVGVVIDEYRPEFGRGDFLVRNVVGADPETGVIAIADTIRPGQTIQFHLRDAASADEDLRVLLDQLRVGEEPPQGALVVSCNGRGTRLFATPGHDVRAVERAVPGLPVAGFFAAGEIGPVGGRSFLHGHTASIAFFHTDVSTR